MTQVEVVNAARDASAGYKVDVSRGDRIGRVSSEWFSRPDDERYLSLSALHAAVRARADRASARTVETRSLRVQASRDSAERMSLVVPGRDEPVAPTHWSFGQMCGLVGAPLVRGTPLFGGHWFGGHSIDLRSLTLLPTAPWAEPDHHDDG